MRFVVGNVTLTRVPYFDVALDAAVAGLTADQVRSVEWADPVWAANGQVLIGQAVWVIECADRVVVVDPCGAADAFIRSGPDAVKHQDAVLRAQAAAGLDPTGVDLVVLSHLDGIGMTALVDDDGDWVPAFPHARLVVSQQELDWVTSHPETQGAAAFDALRRRGVPVTCPFSCANEVTLELTGGHSAGHAVVRVDSAGAGALFLGHLAVNPVQLAYPQGAAQHAEAPRAQQSLDALLSHAAANRTLIVGPLWPEPDAARVSRPPWVLSPVYDDTRECTRP
jgi:glyoxylase-like metal-dependent hydrolase (beta-lactamase superfamily II)